MEVVNINKHENIEFEELARHYDIISKRLFAGRTVIHVLSDDMPEGFESTPASLEDAYFKVLNEYNNPESQSSEQVESV